MLLNRRDLLKQAALSTLVLRATPGRSIHPLAPPVSAGEARAINALQLEPFVDPLPVLRSLPMQGGLFSITMREIRVKMHRDLAPTRL